MTDKKIAVVSTSINAAPPAYKVWAEQTEDVMLFVAGDVNTPDSLGTYVHSLGGVYIPPEDQYSWLVSERIGWKSIQRRNIAILEALAWGADYIITCDDDNAPVYLGWVETALRMFTDDVAHREYACPHTAPSGFFNPGVLCTPRTFARGLPYDMDRSEANRFKPCDVCKDTPVGVVAGLWLGDPDIDAMERMVNAPYVANCFGNVLATKVYAPLNSQSTVWDRQLAPLMAVLPHVGRMDDIWGGYIAQKVLYQLGWGIHYGFPLVRQERNDHDLVKDLEKEIIGYKWTGDLCRTLDLTPVDSDKPIEMYDYIAESLFSAPYFPDDTVDFMQAWANDVRKATS
jgi:reversibly glycosylated polypeptide